MQIPSPVPLPKRRTTSLVILLRLLLYRSPSSCLTWTTAIISNRSSGLQTSCLQHRHNTVLISLNYKSDHIISSLIYFSDFCCCFQGKAPAEYPKLPVTWLLTIASSFCHRHSVNCTQWVTPVNADRARGQAQALPVELGPTVASAK